MEGSTAVRPDESETQPATMAEAFRATAARIPDTVAVQTLGDDPVKLTWAELRDRSDAVAGGLAKLGLERGENVALMIGNSPDFHLVDLAVMTVGGTPFSIYQTSSPEQIAYLISDSEARIALVHQEYLDRVLAVRDELPSLEHVIVVDSDEAPDGVITLAEIEGSNPEFDAEASIAEIKPDDLLTLIYTSGTTGPPKGVELTHGNLISLVTTVREVIPFPDNGKVISWLPNAHIAERGAHHYLPIYFGVTVTCCPDAKQILSVLPQVRPSWFFAVPRIWEKLKAGLETMMASQPDDEREQAEAAIEAAIKKVRLEQAGEEVPEELAAAVAKADEEMFSKLRHQLGLDEFVAVSVGAAPTPVEVLEFFHAIGIPVGELWGMSETCGGGTVNPPEKIKIGTVGPPSPGFEIKLAEDGEVLVKGKAVMRGYRNMPDKTAETIDDDGYLHTGDIGEIDDDGYLKIVDRKKELIINAAGKNMSPANIESTLKASSSLIGQACCIGDGRSYNTALIVLDTDFAPVWASKNGLEGKSLEELADEEAVREEVQKGVDAANAKLSRVEQLKKFTVLPADWEPGGDELTPTMKLKRKPIAEKYSEPIEAMYAK
jgi:long-chain acyl-CoA synthetase